MSEHVAQLAERCEQASGTDYAIDLAIAEYGYSNGALFGVNYDPELWIERNCWEPTASIDAAMALVPAGCTTELAMQDRHSLRWKWTLRDGYGVRHSARANSAALALCAAALRARATPSPLAEIDRLNAEAGV